jgi:hypothetical protein
VFHLAGTRAFNFLGPVQDDVDGCRGRLGGQETAGVILIRFPAGVRNALGQAIVDVVNELGDRISGGFVVVEPGRARLSRPKIAERR